MRVQARSFSRLAYVWGLLLMLLSALGAQTVQPSGPFGFLVSTSYSDPTNQAGAAIQGVMNFDGTGNVRGPYTLEYGSSPVPVQTITGNFTGTYSSNPDGTGSITINLDNGDSLTLAMVISDGGHGLDLVATSCSGGFDLSTSVVSGVGVHAKGRVSGSVAALKGSYGGQFSFSPQANRFNIVANFDGAGNVTLSGTFVGVGPGVGSDTYPGTYGVNSNGTGKIILAATPTQSTQTFVFVMTNEGGPGLLLLQINRLGDGVAFGRARLQ